MKLLTGPRFWLNAKGPFLHKGFNPFHAVLIFLVMMNHVLQLIPNKLRQSGILFLTRNPSQVEKSLI
jgi:hypothetical protein